MIHIVKLLNPKNDYVFKRIFGYEGKENITAGLISSIIGRKVSKVKLDSNPILEKDIVNDKVGILDIKAVIDDNINVDIEMQIVDRKNIKKRILFYWSKMYSKSIKRGEDYNKLRKTIVILISNYEIAGLEEIEKYISKWTIREEEYSKIVLTPEMELYIIEIPKFRKYSNDKNKELNSWVRFIESSEVDDMEENKEIKEAKEILEEISQDEHEQYLAELREKWILDENDLIEQGREEGRKEESISIAKKMKEEKISLETIAKVTGLTTEEIYNL